uniref:FACT complex subunit n=1 Tax=Chromera velia CCMP2878 TaxID=1169474 RepID=A0A0G4FJA7_9ALVE|eukprot:Cvel_17324.t1-p1 / transcript=Cvel_17324.t1 / gene=Cvel_17324 / organism=Chromera_velia_CCMP2878 / gene_product=FACT complex subunit SPT16, putative / transcript_product=FACT complex subunit SPT16, putative / location=Cvel_scaffold1376:5083-9726(+) / protein_length=720 / sequence_SO=supercontig / SO=protein_coding / is_pseudo=false
MADLDTQQFVDRMSKLLEAWEAGFETEGSPWHQVDVFALVHGKSSEVMACPKTAAAQSWLTGWELPDTVTLFGRDGNILFVTGPKNITALTPVKESWEASKEGRTMELVPKPARQGESKKAFSSFFESEDTILGVIPAKARPEGELAITFQAWREERKEGTERWVSAGISSLFATRAEGEEANVDFKLLGFPAFPVLVTRRWTISVYSAFAAEVSTLGLYVQVEGLHVRREESEAQRRNVVTFFVDGFPEGGGGEARDEVEKAVQRVTSSPSSWVPERVLSCGPLSFSQVEVKLPQNCSQASQKIRVTLHMLLSDDQWEAMLSPPQFAEMCRVRLCRLLRHFSFRSGNRWRDPFSEESGGGFEVSVSEGRCIPNPPLVGGNGEGGWEQQEASPSSSAAPKKRKESEETTTSVLFRLTVVCPSQQPHGMGVTDGGQWERRVGGWVNELLDFLLMKTLRWTELPPGVVEQSEEMSGVGDDFRALWGWKVWGKFKPRSHASAYPTRSEVGIIAESSQPTDPSAAALLIQNALAGALERHRKRLAKGSTASERIRNAKRQKAFCGGCSEEGKGDGGSKEPDQGGLFLSQSAWVENTGEDAEGEVPGGGELHDHVIEAPGEGGEGEEDRSEWRKDQGDGENEDAPHLKLAKVEGEGAALHGADAFGPALPESAPTREQMEPFRYGNSFLVPPFLAPFQGAARFSAAGQPWTLWGLRPPPNGSNYQ